MSWPRDDLVARPRVAVAAFALGVAVLGVLALLVHDRSDNRYDRAVLMRITHHVPDRLISVMLHLTDPPLVVVLFLGVVGWAVLRRRWDAVVLAVVVPVTSVLLTEHVLKPWVHRTDTGYLAFPSGHEAGVASFACVAGLLVLGSSLAAGAKAVALLVLAVDVVAAAVGLVGSGYHYASDTIGSLALCLAVTLAAAFVLDALSALHRQRPPRVHPDVRSETSGRATV